MRDHGVGWVSSDTVGHGETLMQRLKIGLLLVITLAVMRAVSRALGRVVIRLEGSNARIAAVVSNAAACTAFVLLLDFSLMPGEPMDYAAVACGVAVFGIYAAWDLFRFPWKPKTCSARRVRRPDFLERPDGNGISRRFRNRSDRKCAGFPGMLNAVCLTWGQFCPPRWIRLGPFTNGCFGREQAQAAISDFSRHADVC